jgi:hypothetical protein
MKNFDNLKKFCLAIILLALTQIIFMPPPHQTYAIKGEKIIRYDGPIDQPLSHQIQQNKGTSINIAPSWWWVIGDLSPTSY